MDRTNTASTAKRIAPGPRGLPVIGSLRSFTKDYLGTMSRGFQDYGEIVRFQVGPRIVHMLSHPELARYVLVEHNQEFPKLDQAKGLGAALGNGLIANSDQASWLRQRRMMQPMFHRKRLAKLADKITAAGERMLSRWQARGPDDMLNIAEEMMRVTLDTITQTMFSADVMGHAGQLGPAVAVGVRYAQDKVQNPLSAPASWPTPLNRAYQAGIRTIDEVVYSIIAERRASGVSHDDLLDMLLEARDEDTGEAMSDLELRNEVLTMFVAGHDTTSNALTWIWYVLATYPEIRARLQAEIDQALQGRVPTLADLPRMPYLQQVINETLRLHPAVPQVGPRRVLADTTLRGYDIPAGSRFLVSIYNIHRHPDFWPDANVFNPDRWTMEPSEKTHRLAFMPFGAGPRLCIGNSLAMMEMQLLISLVTQHYELRLATSRPVEPEVSIIMRPKHGLPMTLHRRT